jgi:hypothetical protein
MITVSTLLILLYAYSIYRIRIDSGSWKQFDPCDSNLFVYLVFVFSTATLSVAFMFGLSYLALSNIIP